MTVWSFLVMFGVTIVHIHSPFEHLVEAKLTINLAKCEFAHSCCTVAAVVYLGKVVGQGRVCPIRVKVLTIDVFPLPSTKQDVMQFLGMVGYYRSFCPSFSSFVVSPPTGLLKGGAKG